MSGLWIKKSGKSCWQRYQSCLHWARRQQEDQIWIYQGSWFSRLEEEIDIGQDLNLHMEVTRESNQGLDQGKANQYAFSAGMTGAFPRMRVAQLLEEMPWLQQDGSLQELSGLWIWMAKEEFGIGIGIGNLLYMVSRVRVQNRNRKHTIHGEQGQSTK